MQNHLSNTTITRPLSTPHARSKLDADMRTQREHGILVVLGEILASTHLSPKLVFQIGMPTLYAHHTGRVGMAYRWPKALVAVLAAVAIRQTPRICQCSLWSALSLVVPEDERMKCLKSVDSIHKLFSHPMYPSLTNFPILAGCLYHFPPRACTLNLTISSSNITLRPYQHATLDHSLPVKLRLAKPLSI